MFTHPSALICSLDLSFRLELVRFLIRKFIEDMMLVITTFLKLIRLIVTFSIYSKRNEIKKSGRERVKLTYNNELSERVGVSVSWRVREGYDGTEFRVTPWISFFSYVRILSKALFGTETPTFVKNRDSLLKITEYLDQKTAAFGMTSSGLPPEYNPRYSLSTYMRLDGFYYGSYLKSYLGAISRRRRKCSSQTSEKAAVTAHDNVLPMTPDSVVAAHDSDDVLASGIDDGDDENERLSTGKNRTEIVKVKT